jgi:hypothetical protein
MNDIAVFANKDSNLCDFFEAERFLIFDRSESGWKKAGEVNFEKLVPFAPALTRKNTEALLPLIQGCKILAGGALVGIPFSVFDRAGLHIFEIGEINDGIFDGIIEDLKNAKAEAAAKEAIIREAKPIETSTPGVYYLNLVALQREFPEISSKKAMMDFLRDTPFMELRLVCKHIPPWIESSGAYNAQTMGSEAGNVLAVITRKC